ncbi:Glycosyl transferases group 1 [Paenacidovorax caeni]|uniref:Glycosyl transferases group 1 n=2 Tax=Paenacidovorax caeni TaxID=343013 RepID=A0A1I7J2A9_9BURK|nr:Glycosyl transferases group 1 [Paenacidovorax caeni]
MERRMNHYQDNRARLDALVVQAQQAVATSAFGDAIAYLSAAATFAWKNHTGVFLDRRMESLIEQIALHVNARYATTPLCGAQVGFLMTSIHTYGGHSKIAWRWMQLDQKHSFQLVLTAQKGCSVPEQVNELVRIGRVVCTEVSDGDDALTRIRHARDQLAGATFLIANIHPDDVTSAVALACLRDTLQVVYIDHAFFSFSLGMPSAHAICSTSPAAVAIATQERMVSPEHLVWYRNSPEWLGQEAPPDSRALREKLGVPEGAPLLLSSGSEHKYYPVRGMGLLDLVAPVLDLAPQAHLVVVGILRPERFQDSLAERFAQRLHWLSPVSERELLQYIAACDIYLDSVPNHSGGAAQQAMLLSKPTLAYVDALTFRAHLAPQLFSVDDFSWIHFSASSYRADLESLIGNHELRLGRGRTLQAQVSSRISERDNLESIQASYRKALQTPLVAQTLLDEAWRVENPALHQVQYEITRGLDAYRKPKEVGRPSMQVAVRAIAFHLPQFHAIPENDAWWGKGFTEWSNVREGRPLFDGHYQPRVPAEMGYYDLSDVDVLDRQARLAREHGLEGFCFYYYWFDGQRLLEKPVDQLLNRPDIDLPFCLCWANENWTRRWDGGEQQVLMRQSYSPELDERFALDLMPYLRDARYIRVNGRPLIMVYRLDIIPDVARSVAVWREVWRREGLGEVYLVAVDSFKSVPPDAAGFDAACEFLPHQVNFSALAPEMALRDLRDKQMSLVDYTQLPDYWLGRPRPAYKRFRGIVPAWDNAARRRKGGATVIHGSTPELYEQWLRRTVARTLDEQAGDERIVFINAWNEWGEGCYLEPDAKFGRAYLEATRRVLQSPPQALLEDLRREREATSSRHDAFAQWLERRDPEGARLRMSQEVGAATVHIVIEGEEGEAAESTRRSLRGLDGGYPPGVAVSVLPEGSYAYLMVLMKQHAEQWWLRVPAGAQFLPSGVEMVRQALLQTPAFKAVYADEVVPGSKGVLPLFRPDFNLDLLVSFPGVMGRHWLFHREALEAIGGFDPEDGGAFELGALLRMAESGEFGSLGHVPEPFLIAPATVSASEDARRAVLSHLHRRGYVNARVVDGAPGTFRVLYGHEQAPLVSVIIPTKDQLPMLQRCVETLLGNTAYRNFEVLIVDNGSSTPEAQAWLDGIERMGVDQLRVLRYPHPFNYSAMNNLAARQARGEYLLLLNNDTAVLQEDWLDAMLNHAQRPEVGIVGAKLLYPDGNVQHAGVVLGLNGPADHPYNGAALDAPGDMHRLLVDQNLSAVTGACLMVRKSLYEAVGGLDEGDFKVSYNDIDLCLKIRQSGHLVVWTPHALMMHVGSVSQKSVGSAADEAKRQRFAAEQDAMYAKWLPALAHDPAYHRHFTLYGKGYEIEPHLRMPTGAPSCGPRILAHPADVQGSGHYRVIQPWRALHAAGRIEGGYAVAPLDPPELERYVPDVIVLQRQIGERQIEAMRRIHTFSRAFKVYELDDYLPNLPLQNAHRHALPRDVLKALRRGLGYVDRFVVSTDPLAEAFAGLHADIRVVENRLPPSWWSALTPMRRQSAKPRVGWAGGVGHSGDLALVIDVVRELVQEVEWVFFGLCPDALLPYVHEYHRGGPIGRYPARLAALNLDLAIAPLEDNLFNQCKSQLKLLEYGACGYPVVCSDVGPYRRTSLPVTKVRNRFKDWVDAIRMHARDLDAAAKAGDALHTAVRRQWMLEGTGLDVWLDAWSI